MNNVVNYTNAKNYSWGKDAAAFELLETENLSVKFEIFPSGETEQLHFHNHTTQCFYVIKGKAKFIIDDKNFALKENDSITIFPKQTHLVLNDETQALHLLVISNLTTKNDRQNITDFDIDGTLCDTKVVGDNCYLDTFEKFHQCSLQDIEWENFTNVTDTGLYDDLVTQFTNVIDYKISTNQFQLAYKNNLSQILTLQKVELVKGSNAFIQELTNKQIDIAIVTGNWKEIAELKMSHCGFNFDTIPLSTSNDAFTREEILKDVIEKSKVFYSKSHYKKVVYFGDGLWDYQCSRNLNIEFIGVDIDNNKKLTKTDTKLIINDFLGTDIILNHIQNL